MARIPLCTIPLGSGSCSSNGSKQYCTEIERERGRRRRWSKEIIALVDYTAAVSEERERERWEANGQRVGNEMKGRGVPNMYY